MDPLKPQSAEVERLLRESHIQQMRGDKGTAAELLRRAADLAPDDPAVWESKGDMLMEIGQVEEARDAFAKALELEPGRVSADKKHASAVFQLQEKRFERERMEMILANPELAKQQYGPPRKPGMALLMGLVIPGSGQIYNGQTVKGGIILGISVVLAIVCLTNASFSASINNMLHLAAGARLKSGGLDFYVTMALFVSFVVWLYSVIDAAVVATKSSKPLPMAKPQKPMAGFDSEPKFPG